MFQSLEDAQRALSIDHEYIKVELKTKPTESLAPPVPAPTLTVDSELEVVEATTTESLATPVPAPTLTEDSEVEPPVTVMPVDDNLLSSRSASSLPDQGVGSVDEKPLNDGQKEDSSHAADRDVLLQIHNVSKIPTTSHNS